MNKTFPFTAIVGQEELKRALCLNVIDPGIGGVLVMGEKGTAKSTAVRAMAEVLPSYRANACACGCDPEGAIVCSACEAHSGTVPTEMRTMRVVELPLGTSEDRLVGSLDIETAIHTGKKRFDPGILAAANRNFLYVDEVNLLDDHLVDLLLDAAAMGVATVEREGVSFRHPARFVLVGSMNPEEGDLRPQLLDRFGLSLSIVALHDPKERLEILMRRMRFEDDSDAFIAGYSSEQQALRQQLLRARQKLAQTRLDESALEKIVALCGTLGLDGHRGDITLARAARAYAAWQDAATVSTQHIRVVAPLVLMHRQKRQPFETLAEAANKLQHALEAV